MLDILSTWLGEEWTYLFSLFLNAFLACLKGLPLTIVLTVLSVFLGFCLAIMMSIVVQKEKTIAAKVTNAFVYFFTGTPLLVQIYIFYYGIPSLDFFSELMHKPGFGFIKEGFIWVLMALTLNTAAYTTVIFSGAIRNMDKGEREAALAYGMSARQAMWRVILPSSLRRALPAYSNEVLMSMHATVLASVVTLMEITGHATAFSIDTYASFIPFVAAGIIYLALTGLMVGGFKWMEKRYLAHLNLNR